MSVVDAFWLAIIQALTEFLPVSSSGHLRLFREFFIPALKVDLRYDLFLHIGTLLAVILYYHRRLRLLLASFFRGLPHAFSRDFWRTDEAEGLRYAGLLIVATIPTVICGLAFRSRISSDAISTFTIGLLLLVNAGILLVAHWRSKVHYAKGVVSAAADDPDASIRFMPLWQAIAVGVAQGFAVFPGISRSGATIAALLVCGQSRERAVEFSFFMSILAITGAVVLEVGGASSGAVAIPMAAWILGFAVTLFGGLAALAALRFVVKNGGLQYFALYCVLVGALAMFLTSGG